MCVANARAHSPRAHVYHLYIRHTVTLTAAKALGSKACHAAARQYPCGANTHAARPGEGVPDSDRMGTAARVVRVTRVSRNVFRIAASHGFGGNLMMIRHSDWLLYTLSLSNRKSLQNLASLGVLCNGCSHHPIPLGNHQEKLGKPESSQASKERKVENALSRATTCQKK